MARHLLVLAVSILLVPAAFAASRVFVASTGTDTGTCTRTAPCRTFAYGVTQASPGGELVALDTAGYGPVSIGFSLSLYAAPGAVASITSTSGDDITINAGPADQVTIRGLLLNSTGSVNGINFVAGHGLTVRDTTFANFAAGDGIVAVHGIPDSPLLLVSNCRFTANVNGIDAHSTVATPVRMIVRDSEFDNAVSTAINISDYGRAAITDSAFTGNGFGLNVTTASNTLAAEPEATVERCTFHGNGTAINANASLQTPSLIHLSNSIVTNNENGIVLVGGGVVASRADGAGNQTNTVEMNTTGNTVPVTFAAK